MATRIIEYGGADRTDRLQIVPATQKLVEQAALTPTTTSQQSAAFSNGTSVVCIDGDEDVYVSFGSNPTATTNSRKVYAKDPQDFSVSPGWKVAVRT